MAPGAEKDKSAKNNGQRDLKATWNKLVLYFNAPQNASSLAVFRILFYSLMVLDIPYERSFAYVDYAYGSKSDPCKFPLFDSLKPLSVMAASMIYIVMLTGAIGSLAGILYEASTIMFAGAYWLIFIQDKTSWNNHSYLYGLIGSMFCLFDANSQWSVDSYLRKYKNKSVPRWNYFILRSQIFLVYFIAGLKKTETDWLNGYSCSDIFGHWVFTPFRFFLSDEYISWFVVHICGFVIDFFVGFLLLYRPTRVFATVVVSSFHCMNSQIFSIGMFPFVMLASTTVFYGYSWPLHVFGKDNEYYQEEGSLNINCIYEKKDPETDHSKAAYTPVRRRHHYFSAGIIFYLLLQFTLPYSHFITKGYNSWTNGLYGYSWDMMVHSWHTQHIKITCLDKKTNKTFFIKKDSYTSTSRWSSHADMIKQHAVCIARQLEKDNDKKNGRYAIYMDIWRSMNHRFEQRQVNPHVDISTAPWSPFHPSEWIIPLYRNLSHWRHKIEFIRKEVENMDNGIQTTFVADAPGLTLTNFIENEISALLVVLDGEVTVEIIQDETNITLNPRTHPFKIPSGQFHNVHVTSDYPACYYYAFRNTTFDMVQKLHDGLFNYSLEILNHTNHEENSGQSRAEIWRNILPALSEIPLSDFLNEDENELLEVITDNGTDASLDNEIMVMLNETINAKLEDEELNVLNFLENVMENVVDFFKNKLLIYKRCMYVIYYTIQCIFTGDSLENKLFENYDMLLSG